MSQLITNEAKLFSDALSNTKLFSALIASSRSKDDAENRVRQYQKVFSNYHDLKQAAKSFSSYVDNPMLSSQYFNATVTGTAKSFAGYLSIERAMDNANGLLFYLDLLGVTDNRKVLPNIGAEDLSGIKNKVIWNTVLATGTVTYASLLGQKLIPGSVEIFITRDIAGTPTKTKVVDDRTGNLLAPAGVLQAGNINYITGAVTLTLDAAYTFSNGDTIALSAFADQTGIANVNRFKTEMKEFYIATAPELLVGETNLASIAAMQKSVNINPAEFITAKLTELYTKIINGELVSEIQNGYEGGTFNINLNAATNAFSDYRSLTDKFNGELSGVDSELGAKSVKGIKATSYLVGKDIATYFKKTKSTGNFQEAPSSYVNDLIGFYDGIPVLRHDDIAPTVGYAIHKTIDGQLAPVGRGIFLPLTNTPTVGNYENPTQQATGVFYQQGNKSIVPELVQKFDITL